MLHLFWCYKRSGGTIANKYIASCENTLVISEVGLYGSGWGAQGIDSPRTIADQMEIFYDIKIRRGGFFFELKQMITLAKSLNKRLVLRDWNVHYYENVFFNESFKTEYYLNYLEFLGFKKLALIRDKPSLWETLNFPSHDNFCEPYARYLGELEKFNFEILSFESELKSNFEGIKSYLDKDMQKFVPAPDFYQYKNVLGDTQVSGTRNLNSSGLRIKRKKSKSIRSSLSKLISQQHRIKCFNDNN